jgi:hypothetical protein
MPSRFERAAAKASKAIDFVFGKRLRFVPKQRVDNWNKPMGAADGRIAVDLVGAIAEGATDFEFLSGDRQNSNFGARTMNLEIRASIERLYFPAGNEPKKGDRIETLDQAPPVTYEILDVFPDGPSRWSFALVRM